ncbi:unnamed protein product [Paramecium octaurelia]|uniref:Uncharacterized protein n=1 Tax=Paramecium octaurelia TaxID=43137 RepID=A0A8S1XEE9_PAROT|nr:unnamed protein product [Paramecium octaurelia]
MIKSKDLNKQEQLALRSRKNLRLLFGKAILILNFRYLQMNHLAVRCHNKVQQNLRRPQQQGSQNSDSEL